MPIVLPDDADDLWTAIEPLFRDLNAKNVDFAALRTKLPPATRATKELGGLAPEGALVVRGSLVIGGGVTLQEGSMIAVLGDLTITGGLWSPPHAFSLVLVGGRLRIDRAHSSGELIAFGGVDANLWWGSGNDHSTYAPSLTADVYVAAEDRSDVIPLLAAKTKIAGFDVKDAVANVFPEVDPWDAESLRTLIGVKPPELPKAQDAMPGEIESLRADLGAAWKITDRGEKVKAIRAVYATIQKRRLADAGPLLVEMVAHKRAKQDDEWSLQDELELLAKLGRADLLESISKETLGGYEGWLPRLLEQARK